MAADGRTDGAARESLKRRQSEGAGLPGAQAPAPKRAWRCCSSVAQAEAPCCCPQPPSRLRGPPQGAQAASQELWQERELSQAHPPTAPRLLALLGGGREWWWWGRWVLWKPFSLNIQHPPCHSPFLTPGHTAGQWHSAHAHCSFQPSPPALPSKGALAIREFALPLACLGLQSPDCLPSRGSSTFFGDDSAAGQGPGQSPEERGQAVNGTFVWA